MWKAASTTDPGPFCSLESWTLDLYHHTSALGSSLFHPGLEGIQENHEQVGEEEGGKKGKEGVLPKWL